MKKRYRPSLDWLLIFIPVSLAVELTGQTTIVFLTSALAIVPLAGLIGRATEHVAARLGPRLGGLLNATLGNITELIVCVLLVAAGEFAIAKASLIGSILGNLLLVLGIAFAVGGVNNPEQRFNPRAAGVHSTSLLLAVAGLVLPALLIATTPQVGFHERAVMSSIVALVLITLYFAALGFTEVTHSHLFHTPEVEEKPAWSTRKSVLTLGAAAMLVGVESELLVSSLEPALKVLPVPAIFIGLIVIPIIANAAEHSSAVFFAIKNRVDLTVEIAVGSSTQIAMLVAPILVFISFALGRPMDFVFTTFEVVVVGIATLVVNLILLDGRSNWLEGVQLLGAYVIIAAAVLFIR